MFSGERERGGEGRGGEGRGGAARRHCRQEESNVTGTWRRGVFIRACVWKLFCLGALEVSERPKWVVVALALACVIMHL